jgi:hypothetical protein
MTVHQWVWSFSLFLLCGCPRLPPLEYGKDGPAQDAADLLKRIEVAELSVFSVKGDARLVVDSPQGKGSVSLFVAAMHPSMLHIEQLDFFGRPEGVLVTDGVRFGLYDGRERKYFQGPASAHNMGRFIPLSLPPKELTALLLGRVPRVPAERTSELRVDEASRSYSVSLHHQAVTQALAVSIGTHRVVRSRVTGVKTYAFDAEDLTSFGAATLPRHLTLEASESRLKVELIYKDITVNEAADLTLFDLSPPEGVSVVEVKDDGQVVP